MNLLEFRYNFKLLDELDRGICGILHLNYHPFSPGGECYNWISNIIVSMDFDNKAIVDFKSNKFLLRFMNYIHKFSNPDIKHTEETVKDWEFIYIYLANKLK